MAGASKEKGVSGGFDFCRVFLFVLALQDTSELLWRL